MKQKTRMILCVVVTVAAALAITAAAYREANPEKTVSENKEPQPQQTVVSDAEELPEEDKTAYVTPSGKSYHLDRECSYLSRSKDIREMTKAEAQEAGYSPCYRCADE